RRRRPPPRQCPPHMPFFHHARRTEQANSASHEDRLLVSMPQWLKASQPSGQNRSNPLKRQLSMDAEKVFRLAVGKFFASMGDKAAVEISKTLSRQRKTNSESMTSEASKERRTGFKCFKQRKAIYGASRTVGYAVFHADNNSRLRRTLHNARGKDTDDAAMPALAVHHQHRRFFQLRILGKTPLNLGQRRGFRVAALAVESFKLVSQFAGATYVARGEKLDDLGSNIHATGRVKRGAGAKGHDDAGET